MRWSKCSFKFYKFLLWYNSMFSFSLRSSFHSYPALMGPGTLKTSNIPGHLMSRDRSRDRRWSWATEQVWSLSAHRWQGKQASNETVWTRKRGKRGEPCYLSASWGRVDKWYSAFQIWCQTSPRRAEVTLNLTLRTGVSSSTVSGDGTLLVL